MPQISSATLLSILVTLSIAVSGCGGREPTPAPPTAGKGSASAQPDQSPSQPTQATAEKVREDVADEAADDSIRVAAATVRESVEPESAGDIPVNETTAHAGRVRIMLLAPGGPMLVDLWLSIDGQPHTRAIETLIERVMAESDTDRDGRSTWKELASNRRFLLGPLAGLTWTTLGQARQWANRFDTHEDGHIQPEEARSWLGRGGGRSAMALALRSYRSHSSAPPAQSRVWRLLDADRDGHLSTDEMDQASLRLLSRDADDNHLLHQGDLDTLRDQIRNAEISSMPTRRDPGRHAALMLDAHSDWYRVWYILSDQYAARGDLGPSSFPLAPTLFGQTDADGDGNLAEDELAVLATRKPHLALRVAFGTSTTSGERGPSLKLLEQSPDLAPVSFSSPRRVVLAPAGSRIDISVHDMAPADDFEKAAAEQLAALDHDRNGYLDEEEVKAEGSPNPELFLTLDADESGMVTAAEIADSLRLSQAVIRSQISLMVHDLGDSVFSLLDTDHDGRLGEREIAGARGHLRSLDNDSDGRLSGDEIPRQMTVALRRGEPQNEQSFNVPTFAPYTSGSADLPEWFVRGDFNRDGEISRREFLGSLSQFHRLDNDANGFIDAQEAAEAESE